MKALDSAPTPKPETVEISTAVNNPRNDSPDILKPA
jgi:hypothetical protein